MLLIILGQLEYGVIHQHFLSTGSIYIVVISLAREVKPQFDYWINYLQSIVDLSECSIIVVGSKSGSNLSPFPVVI